MCYTERNKAISKIIRLLLMLLCYAVGIHSTWGAVANYSAALAFEVQDTSGCEGEEGRCAFPREQHRTDTIYGDTLVKLSLNFPWYAPWFQFRYRLQCDTGWIETARSPVDSVELDSLRSGAYYWSAKAGCPEVGESGWSDCSSFSIADFEEEDIDPFFNCNRPERDELKDSVLSDSSIQLSCLLDRNARWYEFNYHILSDSSWISTGQQNENSLMLDSLGENTYEWRVRVGCPEVGMSDWSDTLSFVIGESTSTYLVDHAEWSIFPNPADDLLQVNLPVDLNLDEVGIHLLDLSGRLVESWSGRMSNLLSVAEINPGVYIVVLSQGNFFARKKLVVM